MDEHKEHINSEEKKTEEKKPEIHEHNPAKEESEIKHTEKEPIEDVVKKESVKISKSKLWAGIAILLGLALVMSLFRGGSDITGKAVQDIETPVSSDEIIFMNSDACTTQCDEMEPYVKELAEKAGLKFTKMRYSQPAQIAGYVLIKDNTLSINGIPDKLSIANDLCTLTGSAEICDDVKTAEIESSRDTCEKIAKKETPILKAFVMSFCPYGHQAQKIVAPVAEALAGKAIIQPNFVIYDKSTYAGREENFCEEDVCSMHGLGELHEDMRQACIWKYDPDSYWDYSLCLIDSCSSGDVDECWTNCLDKLTVDQDKIENCQEEEGIELMRAEKEEMAKYGIKGSEALVLNDERLEMKDYRWSSDKLKNLICCGYDGTTPSACSKTITSSSDNSGPSTGSCG